MYQKEVCTLIDSLYEILGIASPTVMQESVILIACLVLLFFGSIVVLNSILSIISNVFKIDS